MLALKTPRYDIFLIYDKFLFLKLYYFYIKLCCKHVFVEIKINIMK